MGIGKKPTGAFDAAYPVTLPDGSGNVAFAGATVALGAGGLPASGNAYLIASNLTIAGNDNSPVTSNIAGGAYLIDAQFSGTSIKLQRLGADSTTWRDVATYTSSGSYNVVMGENASVRLANPNGTAVTGVYFSLS